VTESESDVEEVLIRLARVGLENVSGFLKGGVAAWRDAGLPLTSLSELTISELRERMDEGDAPQVIDVRNRGEFGSGHIPSAFSAPLALFPRQLPAFDLADPIAVVCEGGYRSSAGASLLQRAGFSNVMNVAGGTAAWRAAGYEVES
jgi:hydroxyacylglutathione hydrolase